MKQISSLHHPLVRHWLQLKEKRSFRQAEQRVLLEGRNCIKDVCSNIAAKRLMTTHPERLPQEIREADEVFLISEQILKKISGVEQSDGLIAELQMPSMQSLAGSHILACDRIQDPGNLGTLIRSCLAFGWNGLFLLPGCADPFNDKSLRAAKGASFSLPLMSGDWDTLIDLAHENDLAVLLADVRGEPIDSFLKEQRKLVILGNEAQGVLPPKHLDYRSVTLHMPGPMESLNVAIAGSILMYLLT